MSHQAQILYDDNGRQSAIQMPYEEYVVLQNMADEADVLHDKIEQINQLLSGTAMGGLTSAREETTKKAQESSEPVEAEVLLNEASSVISEAAAQAEETPAEPTPQPAPEPKPAPAPEPEPVPEPEAAPEPTPEPEPAEETAAEPPSTPDTDEEYNVPVPPMLLDFMAQEDPSQKTKRLVTACAQKLSSTCNKRITISLQKPYICLWDFDEWKPFAFGEIINGQFYLSINSDLLPANDSSDIWSPPRGISKNPLIRLKVDAITDSLMTNLRLALDAIAETEDE